MGKVPLENNVYTPLPIWVFAIDICILQALRNPAVKRPVSLGLPPESFIVPSHSIALVFLEFRVPRSILEKDGFRYHSKTGKAQ